MVRRYVMWDDEIQDGINELVEKHGIRTACEMLQIDRRKLYDLRFGFSQATVGWEKEIRIRRFVALELIEKLAMALDDPLLENRDVYTTSEMIRITYALNR